ncbi:MAG: hypothetical protein ABI759_27010 [Candidatus Solibacter sp.]
MKSAVCMILMGVCAFAQAPPPAAPPKEAPAAETTKGMPPRANPVEYQAQAVLGPVTLAAEFSGHGINTEQKALTTEEYVVVEVGVFGAPGTRVRLSAEDFSLRINGKKNAESTQPFLTIRPTLKDPEWEPPINTKKSQTSVGDEGGGKGEPPPEPPKMPFAERRAMEQRVLKMTLPEGDRATPVAGLIFFSYRGKITSLKSLELVYNGPAGKASLNLH